MKKIPLLVALLLCSCIQEQKLIIVPVHLSLNLKYVKEDVKSLYSFLTGGGI